ncbi:hypothetical protein TNCV_2510731 [Trichonephila clavipes]|nr:hypothetical protein TNCV_2510731 [Trichonephila clavipes]
MACLVTSSSPVPPKTRRVGLSRAETSSHWCGVVVRRGVSAQVSSTSLDHAPNQSIETKEDVPGGIQTVADTHLAVVRPTARNSCMEVPFHLSGRTPLVFIHGTFTVCRYVDEALCPLMLPFFLRTFGLSFG